MDVSVCSIDGAVAAVFSFMLYHYIAAGAVNREIHLAYLLYSFPTTYYLINDVIKGASSILQEIAGSNYSMARFDEFAGATDGAQ